MTNYEYLISKLTGLDIRIDADVDQLDDEAMGLIACPFENDENGDCDTFEGYPSKYQCAACKRKWLKAQREERILA